MGCSSGKQMEVTGPVTAKLISSEPQATLLTGSSEGTVKLAPAPTDECKTALARVITEPTDTISAPAEKVDESRAAANDEAEKESMPIDGARVLDKE